MILLVVQILVLLLALWHVIPIEVLFFTLGTGFAYSIFVWKTRRKGALFVTHAVFILLLIGWMYVPPFLFSP